MSEAVEPGPPAHLVLVHDGAGVAVGEPVLVGQPMRALFTAQERGAGFKALEPLREGSSGDGRDARDQVLMRFRGVVQSQLAPPGRTPRIRRACITPALLATPSRRLPLTSPQESRSTIMAMPCPPPTHIVSRPNVLSWNWRLFSRVEVIRAPVMPNGCPTAIAPPLTLSLSMSIPISW